MPPRPVISSQIKVSKAGELWPRSAIVAFLLTASLLAHPFSLLDILAAWCFLYAFHPSDQPVVLFGRTFTDRETLLRLVVASVLAFFLSTASLIISNAHLFFLSFLVPWQLGAISAEHPNNIWEQQGCWFGIWFSGDSHQFGTHFLTKHAIWLWLKCKFLAEVYHHLTLLVLSVSIDQFILTIMLCAGSQVFW